MRLERKNGEFCIDASLLGELLDLSPAKVQALMRFGEITGRCERGEGEHEGRYRLTFFHKTRRLRLDVDETGRILRRSVINFGRHPLPQTKRRGGAR